jgi:hypothetical protein
LLKKLQIENKETITAQELKNHCNQLNLNYKTTIDHFLTRKHLIRIFRGIFYIKTLDEKKLGKTKYTHLDLVAKGLEIKNVKNWYFSLYTALKLNNQTHEYFTINYVTNDKILRTNPIKIVNHKFRFLKLKQSLFSFGLIHKNSITYSDPEKTILDFIYMWCYDDISKDQIIADIDDWATNLSMTKLMQYAENYPKTVQKIAHEITNNNHNRVIE